MGVFVEQSTCQRCGYAIGRYESTVQEQVERGIRRTFWTHIDEPKPYLPCKIKGYHSGTSHMKFAISKGMLVRRIVVGVLVASPFVAFFVWFVVAGATSSPYH